jgi:hypothetical protein
MLVPQSLGKEGDIQEKGDTELLSLREKVLCPLLSCPLFHIL